MTTPASTPPETLFDIIPAASTPPAPRLTGDRRRTQRQAELLALGQHPLTAALGTHLPLHLNPAPADDRDAPGRRCGNCAYRRIWRHRRRSYPKCWFSADHAGEFVEDYECVTHGPGTDVRAWWPGCHDHTYGEPALSPDAARWIPGADT